MAEAKLSMSLDDIIKGNKQTGTAKPSNASKSRSSEQKGSKNRRQKGTPRAPLVVGSQPSAGGKTTPAKSLGKQNRKSKPAPKTAPLGQTRGGNVAPKAATGGRPRPRPGQSAPPRAAQAVGLGVRRKGIDKRAPKFSTANQSLNPPFQRGQRAPGYGSPNALAPGPSTYRPSTFRQAPQAMPMASFAPDDNRWQQDRFPYMGQASARMDRQLLPGTRLIIKNLDPCVTEDDIKELFSAIGMIQRYRIFYDKSGCSIGEAEVVYANKEDAVKALEKYNAVALDGKRMMIELVADTSGLTTLSSGLRLTHANEATSLTAPSRMGAPPLLDPFRRPMAQGVFPMQQGPVSMQY